MEDVTIMVKLLRRYCHLVMTSSVLLSMVLFLQMLKLQSTINQLSAQSDVNILYIPGYRSSQVSVELNRTRQAAADVLFFLTVPRCGSSTVTAALRFVSRRNHFKYRTPPTRKTVLLHMTENEQRSLMTNAVRSSNFSSVFEREVSFINATKFNLPRPIYVSMIRHPIDRIISWFYFVRSPFEIVERHEQFPDLCLPTRRFLKKDFETCVLNPKDKECSFIPGKERVGNLLEFFCGHDMYCLIFGDKRALQQAKTSIETEFAVVGVLEELEKTLIVLENYIPRFFRGVTETYYELVSHNSSLKNINMYRPQVEQEVITSIKKNFTAELELFYFCKQRLDRQYRAIRDG